ncbi:MAG: MBG domain-containing protein [Gallionella sp.]|nr:MBG domain-containing protein [Gallionella sp.]
MKKSRHCGTWQRNAVAAAIASCFVIASPVYANPIGPSIANGVVSMAQQGNALNITNSPGAIINWQSFSIGVNEATRFIQQSAASSVLNRVTGVDPSGILGVLQSNGRVFLINPNGVLFGAGAQVDVAGLVVSTLNLSNADFLAGRYNFTANAGAGGIENQGSLTALPGGQLYLVAPSLNNSGLITSPQGDVILAAGNSVELVNANSPDMRVVISAPDNQAINLGSIVANSGRVGIYAGLINHHGIVSADTATVGATGKITFKATTDINLEPGSVISASGAPGGVKDGGEVRLIADGKLAMRSGAQVHVDGGVDGGNGGFLELSGKTGLVLHGIYTGRAHKAGYRNGSLLLDPTDINIISGGLNTTSSGNVSSGATPTTFNIDPASLDGGWGAVSLAATNNITIGAPIGTSGTPFAHDLKLNAGNGIQINDSVHIGASYLFSAQAGAGGIVKAAGKDLIAGNIFLNTSGGITLHSGIVQSLSSNFSSAGLPDLGISAGGTVAIGAAVTASKILSITADKIISTGGVLDTTAGSAGSGQIMLNAQHGIGAAGNPIRIQRDFQTVSATNGSGGSGSGDIVLSLVSGDLNINNGDIGVLISNQASNGGIDLTAETGNVNFYALLSDGDIPTGGKLALLAGTDLNIASVAAIGNSTGAPFNHDLTLQAGNNININGANIYLGNNTLTLAANALSTGASGDVIIRQATVWTGGNMNVSGRDFLVGGLGTFGNTYVNAGGTLSIGSPTNPMRDVKIFGGSACDCSYMVANASVTAGSININAQSLALEGGSVNCCGSNSANAELIATNDINITLSGGLTVTGGTVSSGGNNNAAYALIRAGRNATILADGAITLTGGDINAGSSGNVSARIAAANDGSGNLTINGNLNPGAGGLTLTGGNVIGGSGSVDARLSAGSMTVNLSGDALLDNGGALLANVGDITLVANSVGGGITLGMNAYIGAAGNVTLAAVGGNFINNSGSATPITASRTLIYSTIPTSDTLNDMAANFKRYNCTYAAGCLTAGTTVPITGNGFLYSYAPTLAVTAAAQSRIYGAADPAFSYTVSGFEFGDIAATALSGTLGRAAGENVGSYAINSGLASSLGYAITYTGNLGITPASLSVIANALSKVYGSADPALTYTATGFQFSDTAGTALTGSLSRVAGEAVGLYAINQGSLAGANYTIAYTGNNLGITAAPAPAPVDVVQPELNTVLNGALETVALPILNNTLLAAVEQSDAQENPLEKKPTYTCQ